MYLEHFSFSEFPFTLTPNTHFFCTLESYQEALDVIKVSLHNGEGFIKIIGEVGTGKTLISRKLLDTLDEQYITAYIANPSLNSLGIYKALAQELHLSFDKTVDQHGILNLLNKKLLNLHADGKNVVFIIDEAQALEDECLEALRLLSNLETETSKLIQIVLLGQPELDDKLNQSHMRQLKQRIIFSYYLEPIKEHELHHYLCHRLSVAGYTYGSLFSRRAIRLLYKASKGVPRVINVISHKALMVAYGYGLETVDVKAMLMAIADTCIDHKKQRVINLALDGAILFLLILVGIELFLTLRPFL